MTCSELRIFTIPGLRRNCPVEQRRPSPNSDNPAEHCRGSLEGALARVAGELEWSNRNHSRSWERCLKNNLLQVSNCLTQPNVTKPNQIVRRDKIADFVPVDIPINLAIAAAWRQATQPGPAIPVYNCTSGTVNPIRWGQLETIGMESVRKYPMENVLWYPGGSYKEYAWVNEICKVGLIESFYFIANISIGLASLHPCPYH